MRMRSLIAACATLFLLCEAGEAFAQQGYTRTPRRRPGAVPPGSYDPSMPGEISDAELTEMAAHDAALNSLQSGKVSLGIAFPNGGSLTGNPAAGARIIVTPRLGATVLVQVTKDKAAERSSFGGTLKGQYFLLPLARAVPYGFGQVSVGKNSGEGYEGDTELQMGAAVGFGVELFLIRELSTSAEVGLGSTFKPASRLTVATGTTLIGLHYHFGLGY